MRDLTATGYFIRSARAELIPALPAIELVAAQLLRGHAPESVLAETTDEHTLADAARDWRLWVASVGNTPVGFALVKMLAHDVPHLEEIDVDPSHGRRGLGKALVRAVCDWATVSGYVMLTLTTFRAVPWNLPFYAWLGFVEIPCETLRPELAEVVSEEAHRGLDPHTRAVMGIDAGRLPFVNDVPRFLSGNRVLSLVSIWALASRVGRDFESVSAQLHAAPAACSLLASVIKMEHALSTLANAVPIRLCEQLRSVVCQWGKQVVRLARFEP